MFPANRQRNKGAILPMMAVGIVTLVGIAALVLDLGRLFVLKTEMQNAADASALAAAAELDGLDGAQDRAIAAAKGRLEHLTNQAQVSELLANLTNDAFEFYSYIGSEFDLNKPDPCNAVEGGAKCLATGDADSFYVRVSLDTENVGETGSYVVDLFFLPVLKIFGVDAADEASTAATAVAGSKARYVCNYPPLMMCNPFELDPGVTFAEGVKLGLIEEGDEYKIFVQADANDLAPGDFAYLLPNLEGKVNPTDIPAILADPHDLECTTIEVTVNPGSAQDVKRISALNTRFDLDGQGGFTASAYAPGPNVIEYPEDSIYTYGGRLGDGVWDRAGYWTSYHEGDPQPPSYATMTRWDVYGWEVESGYMPCVTGSCPIKPKRTIIPDSTDDGLCQLGDNYEDGWTNPPTLDPPAAVTDGYPRRVNLQCSGDTPYSSLDRRVLYVAVLDCDAQDVKGGGKDPYPMQAVAKFFMTARAVQGAVGTKDDVRGEFMGLATMDDDPDVIHDVIQLYE